MTISTIDLQNSTALANAARARENRGSSTLSADDFLQLMMAQLKYQDPLNPTDSQQFLAQQAQLQSVTELQELNNTLKATNTMMQASSLIGKEVTVTNPDNSKNTITGMVTEARMSGGSASIVINGKEYPLDLVQSIRQQTTNDSTPSA